MSPDNQTVRPSTLCVHAGTHRDAPTGGACSAIFSSTAFAFPNPANEDFYPRFFNTANQRVIARKLAALERGEDALVFGSGMAESHYQPRHGGRVNGLFCDGRVQALRPVDSRVRSFREPRSLPAVAGYPDV